MLLYNETVGIDKEIEQEWLQWMKEVGVPKTMETGMFLSWKIYKVLHDDNEGSVSYSVQYFAERIEQVTLFFDKYAPALMQQHQARFRDRHVTFRTLLEEV